MKIYNGKIVFKVCMKCTEPMRGILNYGIRTVCTPCGGFAKCDERYEEQKELVV